MFTGLIETTGRIESLERSDSVARLRVGTTLGGELTPGDSVAVNGVCLTAVAPDATGFSADLSPATLAVTTLGSFTVGRTVNLERPVRADARMGGHFVLGHVDGVGCIEGWRRDGDCYWLDIAVPRELDPYVVDKGSIAIDGISLTVASLVAGRVTIQIVPFTYTHTALADTRVGDNVNLEADVLGKYVARLLAARDAAGQSLPVLS
jgi:riboflavin synthase